VAARSQDLFGYMRFELWQLAAWPQYTSIPSNPFGVGINRTSPHGTITRSSSFSDLECTLHLVPRVYLPRIPFANASALVLKWSNILYIFLSQRVRTTNACIYLPSKPHPYINYGQCVLKSHNV
jgi:hypothetical protein